ncbi:heavy metal-binding protein [Acidithiobacillus thiooxidans]|uniref:CopZ family metallochaperone n=1 Tax=Pseudomonadota TaxID=1224 RepID=UPI001C072028|nr:cation transporter [Acidithiobacillus thiooxidans]MBU2839031.1 heavy metal-binding protein [Acidithiobacillus thiooxidans]MBU2843680.1 heavy metal-binding protein [Acidithiobacillus thiooxidans]
MSDIHLKITGMTCEHCVRAVAKALEGVPGVEKADVTLEPGEAVVHGKADTTALTAAVKEEGYVAEVRG